MPALDDEASLMPNTHSYPDAGLDDNVDRWSYRYSVFPIFAENRQFVCQDLRKSNGFTLICESLVTRPQAKHMCLWTYVQ